MEDQRGTAMKQPNHLTGGDLTSLRNEESSGMQSAYSGDSDAIEVAIMRLQGFDFDTAASIIRTVYARLQNKHELDRHEQYLDLVYHFHRLDTALSEAGELEVDPRHDEDALADDPRRL